MDCITNFPLHASYPIAFIEDSIVDSEKEVEYSLMMAIRLLHNISSDENKLPIFYSVINNEDFFKIKMFLTERLYALYQIKKDGNTI